MTTTLWALPLGLLLGLGLLLLTQPPAVKTGSVRRQHGRLVVLIAEAGMDGVTPAQLIVASVALAVISFVAALGVSQSLSISLAFGLLSAYTPLALVRHRLHQRRTELRSIWPDVIDDLASAVRAGLSLPEALGQVGEHGPEPLRPAFRAFAAEYRVTGRFGPALDTLKARLADPVGDRVIEALRLAREVGGHDLGRLLRTLAVFLRDDLRTRGEIVSRQSWTVNAAKLAVAAPWALLGLLSLRPQAVAAYDSTAGLVLLLVGAAVSVFAYRLMLRLARLPIEERVLQ
ncbi:MAG: type II secretion system F family protein [Actinomycetes bacterium]